MQQHYAEINRSNSALLRKMIYRYMLNAYTYISTLILLISINKSLQNHTRKYLTFSKTTNSCTLKETECRTKMKQGYHTQINQKIVARLQATKSYYERDGQLIKAQKYIACRNNISQNARRTAYQDFCDESYGLTKISFSKQY